MSKAPATPHDLGPGRWLRAVCAAHRAGRAEQERRRRRKLELNPLTPEQARLYRLLLCGAGLLFIAMMMGTSA